MRSVNASFVLCRPPAVYELENKRKTKGPRLASDLDTYVLNCQLYINVWRLRSKTGPGFEGSSPSLPEFVVKRSVQVVADEAQLEPAGLATHIALALAALGHADVGAYGGWNDARTWKIFPKSSKQ